jgi:hypothetical protein
MLPAEKSIGGGSFHSAIIPYRTQKHLLSHPCLRLASSPPTWAVEFRPFGTLATFEIRFYFRAIAPRKWLYSSEIL